MKPQTKKRLIVISTVLFLTPIVYYGFNYDYHFSRNLGLTKQTQKIFWNNIDETSTEKFGARSFSSGGGGFHDGYPESKSFDLTLNDQWTAIYSYMPWKGNEDVFAVILLDEENQERGFSFYASQKDLRVIKDDSKYRNNPKGTSNSTSPQERQQIDRETTPDSITDTDYLEKLALDKFVEFQNQYFGINN